MVIAGIPREEVRHTRAVQDWLAEGRQEGRQEGEVAVTLRLLARCCGPLGEATTARIQSLPLEQLESLAEALLDFQGADDLMAWLAAEPLPVGAARFGLSPWGCRFQHLHGFVQGVQNHGGGQLMVFSLGLAKRVDKRVLALSKPPSETAGTSHWASRCRPAYRAAQPAPPSV